ncbi:MAG: AAA family ATPase [Myxococcales bacterium]|nr:AAA family ATPase [Myxococcales bacterium]
MPAERAPVEGGTRFVRQRKLGAGGFGVVHAAFDRERNAEVAVKTLARLDPVALYRFKREFRALADVRHPNLVELYELVREGDEWLLSMERVRGALDCLTWVRGLTESTHDDETLSAPPAMDVARVRTPSGYLAPDYARLRAMLAQLASALDALHAAGKLHRDIKPSNVLVDEDGRVVVVDFGIATDLRAESGASDLAHMPGTPEYMAPEQGTGDALTEAADWYAVGVILFEALTGRLPFLGSPLQILLDKQRLEPPRPSELSPHAPGDLAALCLELLRTRPEARPSGADILRRLGASVSVVAARSHDTRGEGTLLVGRDDTLARLHHAYAASKAGRPVFVLVSGRSGVGKTALVRRFLDDVTGDAVVLAGRCYERESVPYKALDAVIDELARALLRLPAAETAAVVPRDAAALVRLFPVLSRVSALADAPRRGLPSDPQHQRMRGFGALRELLARLADRRALVVFIDDLQWGDADSAALLAELAAPPDPPAFLLVGSARTVDEDGSPTLRTLLRPDMRGTFDVRRIRVEPLRPEESVELARALLGSDAPQKLVDSLASESRGEPMLLRELVDSVQSEAGAFTSSFRIEHLLLQRLRQLPDPARRLLEVVSVAGRPLRIDYAVRAAELSSDERREALDWLRVARFARATGGRGTDTVEPYHDRVREALVGELDEAELRAVHERLARTLREIGDADPEALYTHYAGAGLSEPAARYAEEAGEKSARALAFDRAAQFYRQALDLGTDEARRGPLLVAFGDALAHVGRGEAAAQAFLAAAALAKGMDRLDLERRAAEQLLISGHVDAGTEVMRAVLARVGLDIAATPRRALFAVLWLRLLLSLRGLRFRLREADTVAPKTLARIDVCWSAAAGLAVVDNMRAAQFQTQNLLTSLSAGEPERLLRALVLEAVFVATRGPRARAAAARRVDLARGLLPHQSAGDGEAMITLGDASVGYFTGDFPVAARHSERFVALYEESSLKMQWSLRSVQYFGLSAALYLGELALVRQRLPAYLREADERGDLYFGTNLRVGETNVSFLVDDEPDEARRIIDDAMSQWSGRQFHVQHWYEIQARAQADLYQGRAAGALARVEAEYPALRASLLLRVHHTRSKSRWLRGRCALAEPKLSEAEVRGRVLADARALEREGAPWTSGFARLLRAGLAARERRLDEAVEQLRAGLPILEEASLALFAATARLRLGRLLDGAEGKALVEEATRWMRQRGVVSPARLAATFVPGFPD